MSASNVKSLVQSWETVRFELLNRRISDLNLKIEGSPAERFVQRLRRELETKKFIFNQAVLLPDRRTPGAAPTGHRSSASPSTWPMSG